MTDATRTIIRAALAADNAVSDDERAQIEGALRTVCVNGATRICASSLAQLGV